MKRRLGVLALALLLLLLSLSSSGHALHHLHEGQGLPPQACAVCALITDFWRGLLSVLTVALLFSALFALRSCRWQGPQEGLTVSVITLVSLKVKLSN